MTMVCGLDLHRRQITFGALDVESGQVWSGRVWQPDRERFRRWLRDDVTERAGGGPVSIAVEGCTGWRYVVEEVVAAGFEAHLAEPADTQAARGRKRRAKTDRSDCRLLRELLVDGRLPASWIAPTIVLEWRERARLYKTLVDERSSWVQRIHAELYQHGVTLPETSIRWAKTRELLEDDGLEISPAGRQRVLTAYRMIDAITVESRALKADLQRFGLRQPACRALADSQYGIGGLLAVTMWSELGDCQRFTRSEQVVRHSGLDVTVDQSDRRRAGGSSPDRARRRCAGHSTKQRRTRRINAAPTTTTTATSKSTSTANWPPSRWPASSPDAASTCCEPSTPTSSTRRPDHCGAVDGRRRPPTHHESSRGQLPQPACPPASVLDGLRTLTRPRTHDRGGHPISDVVADDEFVEHPGNAWRPRTITPRPSSQHAPALGLVKVVRPRFATGTPPGPTPPARSTAHQEGLDPRRPNR